MIHFCFTLSFTLHVLGKALDGENLLFVNYLSKLILAYKIYLAYVYGPSDVLIRGKPSVI